MVEAKTELKVSSKSMEAAMVARLFKDAMESADPIVGHFVWIRDDGQKLDMGKPVVHPSFPNKDSAMRRLEMRIGQWVSGDKPGLDRNAIARMEISGAMPFDFSMESFEKAALGDDGTLVIAVGFSKGVGREPMELGRVVRVRLYAKSGEPVGRRQALLPIREIIQIQKRERALQAERLESQERQMEESVDMGLQLAQEEDRQWADVSREAKDAPRPSKLSKESSREPKSASPVFAEPQGRSSAPFSLAGLKSKSETDPTPTANSEEQARKMMDMALGAVGQNLGSVLNAKPLPYVEAKVERSGPPTLAAGDDFDAAFEEEDAGPVLAPQAPVRSVLARPKEQLAMIESFVPDHAGSPVVGPAAEFNEAKNEEISTPSASREQERSEKHDSVPIQTQGPGDPKGAQPFIKERAEVAAPAHVAHSPLASQVWTEAPSAPIEPLFLRAVFPDLPEGCDEISVTIQKEMLFAALEALEAYGCLELRIASKGAGLLALGLCIPTGKLPTLTEFLTLFSKGGVMIKRATPVVQDVPAVPAVPAVQEVPVVPDDEA